MKKKVKVHYQKFRMPHLFREDLEDIEKIIKDELNPLEYKLESEEFEYQGINEIPADNDAVSIFHIQTYSPYITIDFGGDGARIYGGEDDLKTIGALKKITEIISRREKKTLWFISRPSPIYPSLAGISVAAVIISTMKKSMWILPSIFVSLFFIVLVVLSFRMENYTFSTIEFVYKRKKSNFFLRNKDQIIIVIMTAILTFLLTLLGQNLFKFK